MKTCFLFGHSDAPDLFAELTRALRYCYEELGIRRFVAGSRGNFDCIEAVRAFKWLKGEYDDVELQRLIAYHPALRRREHQWQGSVFGSTYYPEGLENTPPIAAIRKANELMVLQSDAVICYACHPGNARELLRYARRHGVFCMELTQDIL
ncbi:MAG: hypothetical protein J6J43_08565 [Oscillospiraceae bacterium]|nr:hypothetical protein [Oscillospiraceae bacterium]